MTKREQGTARLRDTHDALDGPPPSPAGERVRCWRRRQSVATGFVALLVIAAVGTVLLVHTASKRTPLSATGQPGAPGVGTAFPPPRPTSPVGSPSAGSVASTAASPREPAALQAGQPLTLSSVTMVGSSGWAAVATSGGCAVVRTTDGGQTWTDASPSGGGLQGCSGFFLDGEHAWIVQGGAENLAFARTADGGATWTQGSLPGDPAETPSLSFVNPTNGWYAETGEPTQQFQQQAVTIWATTDAGSTWKQVNATPSYLPQTSPPMAAGQLSDVCGKQGGISFLSTQTGWLTGGCLGAGSSGITFDVTHDAGATWHPQPLPPPPGGFSCQAGPCSVSAPVFTSGSDGSMVLNDYSAATLEQRSTLYVTTDAGASWILRSPPVVATGVVFATGQTGWAHGGTTLFTTSNGGASWSQLADLPASGTLEFVDSSDGFLIPAPSASASTLYRTGDGGRTWKALTPRLAG
ncbi:MAG: WD40/YVTN/BNR-like repeat-containing protein [Actinomycetota bacterium]